MVARDPIYSIVRFRDSIPFALGVEKYPYSNIPIFESFKSPKISADSSHFQQVVNIGKISVAEAEVLASLPALDGLKGAGCDLLSPGFFGNCANSLYLTLFPVSHL